MEPASEITPFSTGFRDNAFLCNEIYNVELVPTSSQSLFVKQFIDSVYIYNFEINNVCSYDTYLFQITSILMFILIILITAIITKIASIYYASRADELIFVSVPIGLVLIGSLLVTWLLIRVVGIAVDTTFHCFLEDSERNDGSYEKPYFMSEELAKFLSKKENV